jgi:hypothetical protein
MHFNRAKGLIMKRIAKALAIATFATTASTAFADNPYPSSVQNQVPLSQEFPNIDTYMREHRDSAATQPAGTYPAEALQEYPLSSEFPNIDTYKREHRNDPVTRPNIPGPENLSPEPSVADEGLVPGIPGVAPYVSGNDRPRGSTR